MADVIKHLCQCLNGKQEPHHIFQQREFNKKNGGQRSYSNKEKRNQYLRLGGQREEADVICIQKLKEALQTWNSDVQGRRLAVKVSTFVRVQ